MSSTLSDVFLSGLPMQARPAWSAIERLDERLERVAKLAVEAWPGLGLTGAEYLRHLAARTNAEQVPDPEFGYLNGPDLYLAAACIKACPRAVSAFEERYIKHIPNMLASLRLAPDFIEEVQQQLRCRLLTAPPGDQSALAQYEGRGALLVWVRTAATRAALNLLQRAENSKRAKLPKDGDQSPQPSEDRKSAFRSLVSARHREAVRESLLLALASLPPKQRTLLQMHYVDGLTLDAIGKIYRRDKSTISRQLDAARQAVRESLHRQLHERLKVSDSEADSLVDTLTSQLDLSLSDALRPSV